MNNDLSSSAKALAATGSKLSSDVADAAAQAGQLIKDVGSQRYELAREAVSQAQAAATDRARDVARSADGYVREYPWKAIGMAALAGAVIALLFARA